MIKPEMKLFWTNYWYYGRSIPEWIEALRFPREGPYLLKVLHYAVDKLVTEKQLTIEETPRLKEFLSSPDEDANYLALSIMVQKKPKKFKCNFNDATIRPWRITIKPLV